jgi:hypothetical protein
MVIKETKMTLDETNTRTRGQPKRRAKRWLAETAKGCEPGTVSMLKTVYAVVAAAIIAACLVLAPSLSPQVEAGAPSATGKADRADARPLAGDCSERPWPYMEANCLRDTRNPQGLAREVRFVPMTTTSRRPLATSAVASR